MSEEPEPANGSSTKLPPKTSAPQSRVSFSEWVETRVTRGSFEEWLESVTTRDLARTLLYFSDAAGQMSRELPHRLIDECEEVTVTHRGTQTSVIDTSFGKASRIGKTRKAAPLNSSESSQASELALARQIDTPEVTNEETCTKKNPKPKHHRFTRQLKRMFAKVGRLWSRD